MIKRGRVVLKNKNTGKKIVLVKKGSKARPRYPRYS